MEINRGKLIDAIKLVMPAVARKELFDQANKIAFDQGQLIAYNDRISISHPIDLEEGFSGAVDAQRFFDLLSRMKTETIKLTCEGEELKLQSGRSNASFKLEEVALPLDEIDMTGEYHQLPEKFSEHLRLVASTCARDESKPIIKCVLINPDNMQATDGYRSTQINYNATLPKFLLPVSEAEIIADYPITTIALSESETWVRFETDDKTMLCARMISEDAKNKFPNLSRLYAMKGKDIKLTENLRDVLDRARVFSKREHSIDEEVKIELRPNQIVIEAFYEGGKFKEIVRTDTLVEASFAIHPDFLSQALKEEATCVLGKDSIMFSGTNWKHVIALR